MPRRSGCGARPSNDNFLYVSLETGENFLNCDQRDFPVSGKTAGEVCLSCCIKCPHDLIDKNHQFVTGIASHRFAESI